MWRSFASCSLSMIGIRDLDLPARLGPRIEQVALRARSSIAIDVTSSSRIASSGGLVTCANSCLK